MNVSSRITLGQNLVPLLREMFGEYNSANDTWAILGVMQKLILPSLETIPAHERQDLLDFLDRAGRTEEVNCCGPALARRFGNVPNDPLGKCYHELVSKLERSLDAKRHSDALQHQLPFPYVEV